MKYKLFCERHRIGTMKIVPDKRLQTLHFSPKDIEKLYKLNVLFDVGKGGLVLGNSHVDGGIQLIQPYKGFKEFYIVGEMEGYEYISRPVYTETYHDLFYSINNDCKENWKTLPVIPDNCQVIDTRSATPPFLMVSRYDHYIYNRYATYRHLEKILTMDELLKEEEVFIHQKNI